MHYLGYYLSARTVRRSDGSPCPEQRWSLWTTEPGLLSEMVDRALADRTFVWELTVERPGLRRPTAVGPLLGPLRLDDVLGWGWRSR